MSVGWLGRVTCRHFTIGHKSRIESAYFTTSHKRLVHSGYISLDSGHDRTENYTRTYVYKIIIDSGSYKALTQDKENYTETV